MKTSKGKTVVHASNVLPFAAADICAIIKECGLSGVREFNYLGLELRYGPLPAAQAMESIFVPQEIQKLQETQARASFQKSEQEMKDELVQTLLIEDPVGYEKLLREEELIDGDEYDHEKSEQE